MARHLAAGGDLVVTVDPPGVGRSEGVIDGTTGIRLRPRGRRRPGRCDRDAAGGASARRNSGSRTRCCHPQGHGRARAFSRGSPCGIPAGSPPFVRRAGAARILRVGPPRCPQRGGAELCAQAQKFAEDVGLLTKARFGDPLPERSKSGAGELEPNVVSTDVEVALAAASARLLALVGMSAIVPGSAEPELDEIGSPSSPRWVSTTSPARWTSCRASSPRAAI